MVTEQIVKGLLENDQKVIRYIYKNYFAAVEKFVTTNRGSKEDTWDIFQESLIIVFEKLRVNSSCISKTFPGYLYGVCKYQWIRRIRENMQDQTEVEVDDWLMPKLEYDQIMSEVESIAVKEKRDRIFQEAYVSLKKDCQRLIDLVINGCNIEEITDYMDFSSVKYAFRKRQKCRERLMKQVEIRINNLNEMP